MTRQKREAGDGGVAGSWTTTDLGAPPTSLSSLLLLGLHRNGEALITSTPQGTYGLEQKGDGPVSPTEPEPSPAAYPAAFGQARHERTCLPVEEISKRPGETR